MPTTERFLIAMAIIATLPNLARRLARTDHWAPLVVAQIVGGIVLGPGVLGAWLPEYHAFVVTPPVVQALNGIAWLAVTLFVFIAGTELDLRQGLVPPARDGGHRRPGARCAAGHGLRGGPRAAGLLSRMGGAGRAAAGAQALIGFPDPADEAIRNLARARRRSRAGGGDW